MARYLLDPQGGDGTGTNAPPPAPAQPDLAASLKTLLTEKHGNDAMALARDLLTKNRELEADNRRYRQKVKELKGGVPEEGSSVLSKDEAKAWAKYRELGEPGEVKTRLDAGDAAVARVEGLGRAESYRKVAEAAGYKPSVFAALAERDGIAVELVPGKEKGKDGKPVQVAVVKGEGDSATPLDEYVDQHWSDFKPALGGDSGARKDAPATPPRRPFGMPAPDVDRDDPDADVRRQLQASGRYRAGL